MRDEDDEEGGSREGFVDVGWDCDSVDLRSRGIWFHISTKYVYESDLVPG